MSADFTIRIHASEPLLDVLRGVASSLTDLARAIGGPAALARPCEEEPLKICPDPPLRENGSETNSPAVAQLPADNGGGNAMLSPSPSARVSDVSSQTSAEFEKPPPVFSGRYVPVVKWSPERNQTLASLRAMGASWDEVLTAVNKLPGELVASANSAQVHFFKLKKAGELPAVRVDEKPGAAWRGAAMTAADVIAKREAAEVKTPVGPALKHQVSEVRVPAAPVSVDYEQARTWAAERGLVSGHEAMDIEKVNAKRRALGMGVFVVRDKGTRKAT